MGLSWLRELQEKAWTKRNAGVRPGPATIGEHYTPNRDFTLSEEDWRRIQDLITELGLICVPGTAWYGMSFALGLYLPSESAPYPGTEGAFKPVFLLRLTSDHMRNVLYQAEPWLREEAWWNTLARLVYSNENKKLVEQNKLGPLKDKSYYTY